MRKKKEIGRARKKKEGNKRGRKKLADFVTSRSKFLTYESVSNSTIDPKSNRGCRCSTSNDEGKNAEDVTTYCGNRRANSTQAAGRNANLQKRFLYPHFNFTCELL